MIGPCEAHDALMRLKLEESQNKQESLRDAFAIAALQGLIARQPHGDPPHDGTARAAYAYADAMLKARLAK